MSGFRRWPSIESFAQLVKEANRRGVNETLTYWPKVKLHGTNACVRIEPDGSIIPQSRTRDLSFTDDNHGFAAWVILNEKMFRGFPREAEWTTYIFGEWCGRGINHGTACQQVDKFFAPFAALRHRSADAAEAWWFGEYCGLPNWLPFLDEPLSFNPADQLSVADAAQKINRLVERVEAEDPWMKERFGVSGLGEGVVYYRADRFDGPPGLAFFKAKGEKHRVNKTKTAAAVDEDTLRSVAAFVDKYVTDARIVQAVAEVCPDGLAKEKMGDLIGWVSRDVAKEGEQEAAEAGLSWRKVSAVVAKAARDKLLAL
jgi:hypothetical protein